jgi:hypothetical protein
MQSTIIKGYAEYKHKRICRLQAYKAMQSTQKAMQSTGIKGYAEYKLWHTEIPHPNNMPPYLYCLGILIYNVPPQLQCLGNSTLSFL